MNRESRANLIFIVLFLIISIPGAVILVRKKMDPLSRPMWIPDGRRDSMVYIDPTDAPPTVRRVAPAITSLWLGDEARARYSLSSVATSVEGDSTAPVISDNRYFQLLGTQSSVQGQAVYLAFWNLPRSDGPVDLTITAAGKSVTSESSESPVPAAVKKDLQDSGLPRPPQRIRWITATLQPAAAGDVTLEFSGTMDGEPFSDRLVIRGR